MTKRKREDGMDDREAKKLKVNDYSQFFFRNIFLKVENKATFFSFEPSTEEKEIKTFEDFGLMSRITGCLCRVKLRRTHRYSEKGHTLCFAR